MIKGYFAFVLHAHLPYVISHGRWPHGMDWLSEAAAETYLPLLKMLNELIEEGVKPKLTIDISPVLCEQLADEAFKKEFQTYLTQKIKASQLDAEEFYKYGQKNMLKTAQYWEKFYSGTLDYFNRIGQNIIYEFKKLQDSGYLEIMTCGATHGYYPLLSRDESCQVQTKMAVKNYRKHFGKEPRGIWLPECAYRPRYKWTPPVEAGTGMVAYDRKGVDEFLSENGIDFFIVDSALLKGGKSIGVYLDRFEALKRLWGNFEKQYHPRQEDKEKSHHEVYLVSSAEEGKKPTAIFARDPETGLLVWSGDIGYPGDGHYLDFHKKRFPGGHRYWAVTSSKADLADKVEYDIEGAETRIPENSDHYVEKIVSSLIDYHAKTGRKGILMAPYDAELFGHWWFEGPKFLKAVIRKISLSPNVDTTFLSEHYDRVQPTEIISIPEGSWGEGGNHYIWLNEENAWTWKHIYQSEKKMCEQAQYYMKHKNSIDNALVDVLKQAARELMLMSASDWQFLISTWSARDYAELRLTGHYEDFIKLTQMADKLISGEKPTTGEWEFLGDCSRRDDLFAEIELEWFARVEYPIEIKAETT
ncbi:MAG: 1,4-alpha-glucan branching protein domain-containing protein [Candidatus Zixiibacteriota bacterium]